MEYGIPEEVGIPEEIGIQVESVFCGTRLKILYAMKRRKKSDRSEDSLVLQI
jgi:hypothetical protein